jgi:hypothetical protein
MSAETVTQTCLFCSGPRPPENRHFCSDLCRDNYFASVKASHSMPAFCAARGIELKRDGIRLKAFCPFHAEKNPSFCVFPDGGAFCFGCNWAGTVIDLCAKLDELSPTEAAQKLSTGSPMLPVVVATKRIDNKSKTMLLPALEIPTASDLQRLSVCRSIPIASLLIDARRGFLWCYNDEFNGRCWLFTDRRRKCAIRRRLDGKNFKTWSGTLTKAAACAGSIMTSPLGYEEARDFPYFAVVEGAPNGLSVTAQALASGVEDKVAPIVMPCTGSRFTPTSLEWLSGKVGRIFIDDDEPGRKAAAAWAKELRAAGIVVDGFSFHGLIQNDGRPVGDINDLCRIDAGCHEKYSSVLESLMNFAEPRKDVVCSSRVS